MKGVCRNGWLGPKRYGHQWPSLEHKEYGGKPWKFRVFPGMFKEIYIGAVILGGYVGVPVGIMCNDSGFKYV